MRNCPKNERYFKTFVAFSKKKFRGRSPFCEVTVWFLIFTTSLDQHASLVAQLVKNPPAMQRPPFCSWVRKVPWRRGRLPTPVFWGFPGDSDVKESSYNMGVLDSDPCVRKIPGGGTGYPLEHSGLENPMHRGAWQATVHGSQRVGHDWAIKHSAAPTYTVLHSIMFDIRQPGLRIKFRSSL